MDCDYPNQHEGFPCNHPPATEDDLLVDEDELVIAEVIGARKCDFCGKPAHYDGATTRGPWAYMCTPCFEANGVGLGTGRGQLLVVTP